MTYVDTSVLFSLYVSDANSTRADAWRQANPEPIAFTGFHRIELRNALSLAVFQQRLTPAQAETAWTQVQEDLKGGILVAKPDLWARLVREAEELATHHTPKIGTRSLDILHVSAASVMGATEFAASMRGKGNWHNLQVCELNPSFHANEFNSTHKLSQYETRRSDAEDQESHFANIQDLGRKRPPNTGTSSDESAVRICLSADQSGAYGVEDQVGLRLEV